MSNASGDSWTVYNVTGEYGPGFQPFLSLVGGPSVLEEAAELIGGDRESSYGHPLDDFSCTAALWSSWLSHKYGVGLMLEPEDVGWLMALLKISREGNLPKRDNMVDAAGYIGCVEKIQRERRVRSVDVRSG